MEWVAGFSGIRRLYDLLEEIHHLAEDQNCWVEAHITDPATGRAWD